jgi:hypothetical protein
MQYKRILFLFLLFALPLVLVQQSNSEPTYQFNKLYLTPFYRASMVQNTNYTYSIEVNPPDKISKVANAMLTFQVYYSPTVTYNLWVNNQVCNNPTFTISTTYAGAGMGYISFDCSNIITKSGTYNIKIRSTKDSGASYGWLDLTYMNKPKGTTEISGTEYQIGDSGTVFLQLKDSEGFAVKNATCSLTIFYPKNASNLHPVYVIDAPMLQQTGKDGLYYYDFTAPSTKGVYMVSALCGYSYNYEWVYGFTEPVYAPKRKGIIGTSRLPISNISFYLNSYIDEAYGKSTSVCDYSYPYPTTEEAYYDFNLSRKNLNYTKITGINAYYMGETEVLGGVASPVMTMYVYNWTSSNWRQLTNTLSFTGLIGISNDYLSNSVPTKNIISSSDIIRIRLYTVIASSSYCTYSFNKYDNFLNLQILTSQGEVQELKGSGELHIVNRSYGGGTSTTTPNENITKIYNTVITINRTVRNIKNNMSIVRTDLDLIKGYTDTLETGQATIISNQARIVSNLTDIRNTIKAVNTSLFTIISADFTTTLNKLNNVSSNINSGFALTLTKLNNITVNLNTANNNINTANSNINKIEAKLDCNHTTNILCNKLNSIDSKIITINTTLNSIKSLSISINTTVINTRTSVKSINNTVNLIYAKVNNISVNIGNVTTELNLLISLGRTTNLTVNGINSYLHTTIYPAIIQNQNYLVNVLSNISTNHQQTINKLTYIQNNISVEMQKLDSIISISSNINATTSATNSYIQTTVYPAIIKNENHLLNVLSNLSYDYNITIEKLDFMIENNSAEHGKLNEIRSVLASVNQSIISGTSNILSSISTVQSGVNSIAGDVNWIYDWTTEIKENVSIIRKKIDNISFNAGTTNLSVLIDYANTINTTTAYIKSIIIGMNSNITSIKWEVTMTLNNTIALLARPFGFGSNDSGQLNDINSTLTNLTSFIGLAFAPTNATLVTGQCNAASTGQVMVMGIFILLAMFLITLGTYKLIGIYGFFGAIILLIMSWYLVGCSHILAYVLALFSLVLIVIFAVIIPIYRGRMHEG